MRTSRITVESIRKGIKERIESLKENLAMFDDDEESREVRERIKAQIQVLIDVYNSTFSYDDKRNKTWKCKICGKTYRGVLKPIAYHFEPFFHECQLEKQKSEDESKS